MPYAGHKSAQNQKYGFNIFSHSLTASFCLYRLQRLVPLDWPICTCVSVTITVRHRFRACQFDDCIVCGGLFDFLGCLTLDNMTVKLYDFRYRYSSLLCHFANHVPVSIISATKFPNIIDDVTNGRIYSGQKPLRDVCLVI